MSHKNTFNTEDIQQHILTILDSNPIDDTRQLNYPDGREADAATSSSDYQLAIKSALDSLVGKEMVIYQTHNLENHVLTPEGQNLVEFGSYEYRVWEALGNGGLLMKDLQAALGEDGAKIGQGKAFRNKWIKKNQDGGFIRAIDADKLIDQTKLDLISIQQTGTLTGDDAKGSGLADYRKRKLCERRKYLYFSVQKGPQFSTVIEKPETDLTVELLASGRWKTATFKPYNFNAEGVPPNPGALHPLMKVREEFRNIFFEMGLGLQKCPPTST